MLQTYRPYNKIPYVQLGKTDSGTSAKEDSKVDSNFLAKFFGLTSSYSWLKPTLIIGGIVLVFLFLRIMKGR